MFPLKPSRGVVAHWSPGDRRGVVAHKDHNDTWVVSRPSWDADTEEPRDTGPSARSNGASAPPHPAESPATPPGGPPGTSHMSEQPRAGVTPSPDATQAAAAGESGAAAPAVRGLGEGVRSGDGSGPGDERAGGSAFVGREGSGGTAAGEGARAGSGGTAAGDGGRTGGERYAPRPRRVSRTILVGGGTRVPSVRRLVERATGVPADQGLDPEQCVALGAAVRAGLLSGQLGGLELGDGAYAVDLHSRSSGFFGASQR